MSEGWSAIPNAVLLRKAIVSDSQIPAIVEGIPVSSIACLCSLQIDLHVLIYLFGGYDAADQFREDSGSTLSLHPWKCVDSSQPPTSSIVQPTIATPSVVHAFMSLFSAVPLSLFCVSQVTMDTFDGAVSLGPTFACKRLPLPAVYSLFYSVISCFTQRRRPSFSSSHLYKGISHSCQKQTDTRANSTNFEVTDNIL